jgi:hypothetical protein
MAVEENAGYRGISRIASTWARRVYRMAKTWWGKQYYMGVLLPANAYLVGAFSRLVETEDCHGS